MNTTLEAMLFDFGGTLERAQWTEEGALRAAGVLLADVRKLGARIPPHIGDAREMLEAIVAGYEKDRIRRERTLRESSTQELWTDILAPIGAEPGSFPSDPAINDDTERLTVYFEQNAFLRIPVSGGRELLQALCDDGIRLAIVSNVITRTRVPAALAEYGLDGFFEHVTMSSVFGRRKPDPEVFHHAAGLMGLSAGATGYVGDRLNRDVLGARQAGCGAAILFTGAEDFLPRVSAGSGKPDRSELAAFPSECFEPDMTVDTLPVIARYVHERNRDARALPPGPTSTGPSDSQRRGNDQ